MKRYIHSATGVIEDDEVLRKAIEEFGGALSSLFRQEYGRHNWCNLNTYKKKFYTFKYTPSGDIRLQFNVYDSSGISYDGPNSFVSPEYEAFEYEYYKTKKKGDPRTAWRDQLLKEALDVQLEELFNSTLGQLGYILKDYKYSFRPGINNPDYLIFIFS